MKIVLIASVIFIAQTFLAFFQVRYYQHHMNKVANKYAGKIGYHLYSEMERLKFRTSAVAILVVNEEHIVHECQILTGKTIFAKFKTFTDYHQKDLSEILQELHEKKKHSIQEKAIIKTVNSCMKAL
ncbi:transcriptional regulator GutM [Listeria innocua]|uniref:transcriptional regulator GutM n=1 Tax=Listeria TaxID=1637 RepID=UPI000F2DC08A|nr:MULTISPECIES: transcriptional regulator GutM [Listeria]EAD5868465.1 transcriptional regulator [Listeria innocua]EAF5675012.1 transcriptional regulator [Listeria innocua]EDO1174797.1 transcriptional regulator [Listeria innocua]EEJ0014978.1 transcriptional regulator [Listeria innocua]EEJ1213732.1 transcriptional regulator [Listeria innocua]